MFPIGDMSGDMAGQSRTLMLLAARKFLVLFLLCVAGHYLVVKSHIPGIAGS